MTQLQGENPMTELLILKQSGTIFAYHVNLSFYWTVNLIEEHAVSIFLNGMRCSYQKPCTKVLH